MKVVAYKTWKKQQINFRKVWSTTLTSVIEVKSMEAPTNLFFYLDYTYDKRKKKNSTNRTT